MDSSDSSVNPMGIKKKRGRKPKNFYDTVNEQTEEIPEKKKRGRRKKYEVQNSDKINNREDIDNFNHSIVYSDSEDIEEGCPGIKQVAFGNLSITVSKKVETEDHSFKNTFEQPKLKEQPDSWNDYSDDEIELDIDPPVTDLPLAETTEKYYSENKKYIPESAEHKKGETLNRFRVISCLKNVVREAEFPEKTDIHCWWCCHQFTCQPCPMPTKYDERLDKFSLTGIFCSWGCVKAYSFDMNDYRKHIRSGIITILIKKTYGTVYAVTIKPAPPRQCLKMFGGYLSIDEFRNTQVDKYNMSLINYNFIYPEVTEISNVNYKTEKKNLRLSRK